MIGNAAIYIWQLMLDRCRNGKSQNPYLTGQVNLKFQKPMTETLTRTESQRFSVPGAQEPRPLPQMWTANFFGILSFGHWNLFGIGFLVLGILMIFIKRMILVKSLSVFAILLILSSCATYYAQEVGPTPIMRAEAEIPEDQLMDVGVLVFKSAEITEEKAEKEGTHNDIRKAEKNFIPYHLKNTLQHSGQWGAVQVIPAETDSFDLLVKGEILESNGQYLGLKIEAVDASDKSWFKKNYRQEVAKNAYEGTRPGEKDAFQNIYNAIANEMAELKNRLTPEQIHNLRTTAKLRFAEDFAPDAFKGYLAQDKNDLVTINRLPADDDPMMQRLFKIREREYMYIDLLNEQYERFYTAMWLSYENWRQLNMTERKAIKEIKKKALTRQLIGALMIAGAVAAGVSNSNNTVVLQTGLILIGGQVILDGFNISKEAEIHEAAIRELSDSFSGEMKPVVMEFEGKQYELTGSAEEQFKKWRALLRKIYYAETGFEPDQTPDTTESGGAEDQ